MRLWLRRRAPLLAWLSLVSMTSFGFYLAFDGRHDACVARNQSTTDAVTVGAESLIEVAADADDRTVAQYREVLRRRLAEVEVDC